MFTTRVLTVAIALPLFAAALVFLPQHIWAWALLPFLAIASWEWAMLARFAVAGRAMYALIVVLSALALLYSGSALDHEPQRVHIAVFVLSAAFWLLLAPFWIAAHWAAGRTLRAIAGWIALVPTWLALVLLQNTPWVLLSFLGIVWVADTAAYLSGRQWGRHRLAPVISPGKTWEGALGAAAAVAIYYGVLQLSLSTRAGYFEGAFGLLIFVAVLVLSVEGDLFESLMKRQAGVKDSGHIFPGHGGVLDRIDGLTATMPAAALAFYLH